MRVNSLLARIAAASLGGTEFGVWPCGAVAGAGGERCAGLRMLRRFGDIRSETMRALDDLRTASQPTEPDRHVHAGNGSNCRRLDKMIQARHQCASIMCDITPARRCGSNWRNCGKFDGTPQGSAYGSCVRRYPRTACHGSGDLPRLAGLGRRRRHAHAWRRFISHLFAVVGAFSGKSPKPRSTNRCVRSCEQQLVNQQRHGE